MLLWIIKICCTSYGVCGQSLPRIQHLKYPSEVSPGEHFTIFCDILYQKGKKVTPVQVVSPPSWSTILTKQIPMNDSVSRFVQTIVCPTKVSIRPYYFVFRNENQNIANFPITIKKIHQLNVVPLNLPDFIKEGDTLDIAFSIQNSGNLTENLVLGLNQGRILSQQDTLNLKINPNENLTISSRHIIKATNQGNWSYSPILTLKTRDTTLQTVVSVPVYGVTHQEDRSHLRFPLEVSGVYIGTKQGETSVSALQYDIKGKGFLDFDSRHFLDFTVHGPNQFQVPMIGSYEVYALKYDYKKNWSIQLGDYNLRLSNLLEFGRFSRGGKINWQNKNLGVSIYSGKPRFASDLSYQVGGNLSWNFNDNNLVGLGFQRRGAIVNSQIIDADILNVYSKISTSKIRWEAEIAQTQSKNGRDYAFQNYFNWYNRWLQISSNTIYAGKNYYGFYRNGWLSLNTINFILTPRLSLGVSYQLTRINPSFDLLVYNSSPYLTGLTGQLSYRFNHQNTVRISYNKFEREDRLEPKSFYYRESFANLGYEYNGEKFAFYYNGRWGNAENLLVPNDENIIKQSISNAITPQVRVLPTLWVGGILEHLNTSKYSLTNSNENYYFYGGSFRLWMKPWLNASATYRNNFTPDALIQTQSFITGNLNIDLKQHSISLMVGQSFVPKAINLGNLNRDAVYFSLKYTLKINLPIAKDKRQGTVIGQLTTSDPTLQVNNVMVSLGAKMALTDTIGRFTFNKVLPDKYLFRIEPNLNFLNVAVNPRGPIEVQVKNDSIHTISVNITRTGIINGVVQFVDAAGNRKSISGIDLPNIFVRIQNQKESIITKVNSLGEFSFGDIAPDTWNLTAWLGDNQKSFQLIDANQNIQVNPSKTVDISLGIQTSQRKLVYSTKNFQLKVHNENP